MRSSPFGILAVVGIVALAGQACQDIGDPSTLIGIDTLILPAQAPADGASLTRVFVRVDSAVPRDKRSVALHASSGTFDGKSDTSLNADVNDTVFAFLRSSTQLDTALVTATLGTTLRRQRIVFVRAYPDSIKLTVPKFAIDTGIGTTITVSAYLKRVVGKATAGATVMFSAIDSATGKPHGLLSKPFASDSAGVVNVVYTSGDPTYTGTVYIDGSTATSANAQITDRATLWVTKGVKAATAKTPAP